MKCKHRLAEAAITPLTWGNDMRNISMYLLCLITPPYFSAHANSSTCYQSRVENDIRNMEGVMDIDIAPAATTSTQSPSAPETPSGTMSQGSVSGDAELLLPVVMSVSPPTMEDYRALLARVQAL